MREAAEFVSGTARAAVVACRTRTNAEEEPKSKKTERSQKEAGE